MSRDSDVVRKLTQLERRLDNMPRPERGHKVSEDNVSNPPTDAELDTAFPNAYNGFVGIVDDGGLGGMGGAVWLVVMINGVWFYEQLTQAV